MGAVVGGLTLLELVEIVAGLTAAGRSTTSIVDWIEKRKKEGVKMDATLSEQHAREATNMVEASANDSTAEGFIQGTLGR
jgi:hypothetical protein